MTPSSSCISKFFHCKLLIIKSLLCQSYVCVCCYFVKVTCVCVFCLFKYMHIIYFYKYLRLHITQKICNLSDSTSYIKIRGKLVLKMFTKLKREWSFCEHRTKYVKDKPVTRLAICVCCGQRGGRSCCSYRCGGGASTGQTTTRNLFLKLQKKKKKKIILYTAVNITSYRQLYSYTCLCA